MDSTPARLRNRAGRVIAATLTAAVAFTGISAAPTAHAATSATASTAVDTDDTGPATMTFVNPQSARVGEPRFVTFTVEGNRSAGKPAWIEMFKHNFDTGENVLVYRHDLVMTTAPQVVQIPVDTSKVAGNLYFLDYDWHESWCKAAGFSYTVMPNNTSTPEQPTDPTEEDETGDPTSSTSAVTVNATATKVRPGARVRLTGVVSGTKVAELRVIARAKTSNGWAKVGSTTTSGTGRYTLRTRGLVAGVRKLKVTVPALSITATRSIRVLR